ncbi:MAG: hypothetical protein J6J16_06865 [Lachnospiraceae bacterium]|nr:hypothetical protein [Lachnospiraceae bacterium]
MSAKKSNISLLFFMFLATLVVVASFILPGYLLDKKADSQISVVSFAPEEYYLSSNTVMARNNSEKLSSLDKLNLISGKWASNYTECSTSEAFLSEIDAVNLATAQINKYYDLGVYPESLFSNYNNWYSWSSKVYRYTDSSFNTYTAYLWVITFTKYDNSATHKIAMTEDGIIISAETTNHNITKLKDIFYAYTDKNIESLLCDNIKLNDVSFPSSYNIESVCPDINMNNATFDSIYQISVSENFTEAQDLYVFQYKTGTSHGIGLIPVIN